MIKTPLDELIGSWVISLRARHLAPKTVTTYRGAAERMHAALPERCRKDATEITRSDLRDYFAGLAAARTPGGVSVDYRALQQFFKWADRDEEITPNPMDKMDPPTVPEAETRVLRKEQIEALLKACKGTDFMSRRDTAIISLLLDTGIRRAECASLTCEHVDIENREVYVMGKGRRARYVPFSHRTAQALDRYNRVRKAHRLAHLSGYWLGERSGAMTVDGIHQVIERRGIQAGIRDLHPHMFRHTFAHFAKDVVNDDELMRLAGWKSRQMLGRYAASTADERAREAGKRSALLDRL
ncbi:MAG TPA: tyrosine-type recombinase/integrase [Terriglobales bacterium]|nr:tyrosine-type recombinase/integrase [Terriglobales bacterium]